MAKIAEKGIFMGFEAFRKSLVGIGVTQLPTLTAQEIQIIDDLTWMFEVDKLAEAMTKPVGSIHDDKSVRKFTGLDLDSAASWAQSQIFPWLARVSEATPEPDWDVLQVGLRAIESEGGMQIDGPYSNLAPFLKSWGGASGEPLRQINEFQEQTMIPYQLSVVRSYAGKR